MHFFEGKDFCFELNKRTYIMGILNITADSFYDGGKWNSPEIAVKHAIEMCQNGADIIDVGAQSTRPGHKELTETDELNIIKNYIDLIVQAVNVPVSVDTFYPEVADYCLSRGANIINDVSGVFNPQMAKVVKKYNAGWIIMHTGGADASTNAIYKDGVVADVVSFFKNMIEECNSFGINKSNLCLDMGIGFGKTNDENLELIRNTDKLKFSDIALLTALSNKRVVANATSSNDYNRVFGTIAANTIAIAKGTDFIRVHEVKEAKIAALMADKICRGE